jgi:transcriptional regulator with XRE-family HTH domain
MAKNQDQVKLEIGIRFFKMRTELGLTQEQLGNIIEVTGSQISQFESGKALLSALTLRKLISLFCINANWLLTGKGNMRLGH